MCIAVIAVFQVSLFIPFLADVVGARSAVPADVIVSEPNHSPKQDLPAGDANTPRINLTVRDSYLPGVPILVRVEVLRQDGAVDRDVWDANAALSVSNNPTISLSPDRLVLRNGLGSSLVTFTGEGDFGLTVRVNDMDKTVGLADWTREPVHIVSGALSTSQTWSGVYHVTGGDLTIPKDVTLTLEPGTFVLIDGAASGTNGTDIEVQGSIQSLGTPTSPVTFTAYAAGRNWGELHHDHAQPSAYRYTEITRAGRSPGAGHTGSGPAVRASNSTLVFDHASLTDNIGKIMQAESGTELSFTSTLFSRSVMGPEISGTSLLFEDGWIIDMRNKDDADGIYIHSQQAGQTCRLAGSVIAGTDDDGIDTLGSNVVVEDCIIRGCRDKAVSVFGGQTTLHRCLLVGNNLAPEDPTIATIATKSFEGSTAVVNIDHTTLVASRSPGHIDAGIQSHNKYGVKKGTIIYNVTNSIVDATQPVSVQAPYLASDIHISYSDIVGADWPGMSNWNADPQFLDPPHNNYRLKKNSPCVNAADPNSLLRDLGYYQSVPVEPNEAPPQVP